MPELSLRERTLRFLMNHPGEWFNGGMFERKALELGYKASNISRRLRELAEEGKIERKEMTGQYGRKKSVWYRVHQGTLFN